MKKIFANGGIYLVANILNAAVPLLLLPILTRILSPEDYGLVAMFGFVFTIFSAFTGMGTHGAVSVRFFQLNEVELSKYVFSCLVVLLPSSMLIFLIIYIGGKVIEQKTLMPVEWLYFIVFVASAQFIVNIRLALWQAQKKAVYFGAFQVSNTLVNTTFSLCFLFFIAQSWESRVLGQSVAITLFAVISLLSLIKAKEIAAKFDFEMIRDALKFGMPLIPHSVGGVFLAMADRVIIANSISSGAAGIYMVGLQVGLVMGLVADSFVKVYGPVLYELLSKEDEREKFKVVAITYIVFFVFPILVFPLYLIMKFVFPILIGIEYAESVNLIFFFLLGNAFTGMYYAVAGFYFFSSRTSYISMITITVGAFSITLTYLLVNSIGVIGGAISYAASQFMMLVMAFYFSRKICPLPWFQVRKSFEVLIRG